MWHNRGVKTQSRAIILGVAMAEPDTLEPPTALPFDPTTPKEWERRLRELPLRATVAFAVRCAKRVEPHARLGQLRADAYSAGIDTARLPCGNIASAYTANAAAANADASADNSYRAASQGAGYAAAVDARTAIAAVADLKRLLELNLGKTGEPGEPIRWNDPRLGPLWPHGEPQWYTQAIQAFSELEERLRGLPLPNSPPDPPALLAQMQEWAKAEQFDNEGKFNEYRGEYVFFSNGIIFGHGRNLADLRPLAEEKAAAAGVPPERVVNYFVPGE